MIPWSSLKLHHRHDNITGRSSHYVRQATRAARTVIGASAAKEGLGIHAAANKAKQECSAKIVREDPVFANDQWACHGWQSPRMLSVVATGSDPGL